MIKANKIQQNHDAKYDFLKFFLSIFIIAIHTQLYPLILYPWLRIAVPLFFMISSYFLFSKLQIVSNDEQKIILKKFVFRNVKLYCFWFVVLLPITLYRNYDFYFTNGIVVGILNFLKSLFFNSTFVASWYIPASVIGVLLVYLMSKKLNNGVIFVITFIAFSIVSLLSSYYSVFSEIDVINKIVNIYVSIVLNPVLCFPTSLFWIFAGKCFAENKIKFASTWINIILLILSCCGLFLEWKFVRWLNGTFNNDSYFMLLPVCICLFGCIQNIKPINYKYAHYFKHASTIIYVVHGSMIIFINFFCSRILHINSNLLNFVTTFICCIFVYICIEYIMYRFPEKKIAKILKNAY